MSIIRIDDLTFAYEGAPEPVFRGLTLELDDTWKLALTGRNGRGKTTLLKLLSGELDARGRIHAAARFARFPFAVEDASLPARAAMAAVCGAEDWRIEREAGRIGLDEGALDRPLDTLSGGERMKALLSALFLIEGCVPLIDEPTNHLDAEGRRALGRYLAGKRGFILASHDRDLLDACCDHVLALEGGGATLLRGGFSDYLRERERREAMERAEEERLRGEIRRLGEAARRAGEWAGRAEKAKHRTSDSDGRPERGYQGHKAAKLVKRAKGIERRREEAVEQKSQLLRHVDEAGEVRLRPAPYHAERLCGLENACVRFDGRAALRGVESDHFARRARGAAGRQRLRQDHGAAAFDGRSGGGRGPRLARRRPARFRRPPGRLLPARRSARAGPGARRGCDAVFHHTAQTGLFPRPSGSRRQRTQRRAEEKGAAGPEPVRERPPLHLG